MSDVQQITPRILVTTDFSVDSERAFFHALAFAVKRKARLTLLHTGSESRNAVPWEKFPGVRQTLAGWGLLPTDSPRNAVAETLGVGVAKMAIRDDDPRQGITDYLRKHPTDLLVMASEGRSGFARLFNPSVAETVSFQTNSHTLMLPKLGRGFVDPTTGHSSLRRVLCAIEADRDPRPALRYLKQWLPGIGGPEMEITVLQNVAPEDAMELMLPNAPGLTWHQEARAGDATETVLTAAREHRAELVVMATRRPLRLLGRLRGSHTDRILRELRLPLLSVPPL